MNLHYTNGLTGILDSTILGKMENRFGGYKKARRSGLGGE